MKKDSTEKDSWIIFNQGEAQRSDHINVSLLCPSKSIICKAVILKETQINPDGPIEFYEPERIHSADITFYILNKNSVRVEMDGILYKKTRSSLEELERRSGNEIWHIREDDKNSNSTQH